MNLFFFNLPLAKTIIGLKKKVSIPTACTNIQLQIFTMYNFVLFSIFDFQPLCAPRTLVLCMYTPLSRVIFWLKATCSHLEILRTTELCDSISNQCRIKYSAIVKCMEIFGLKIQLLYDFFTRKIYNVLKNRHM